MFTLLESTVDAKDRKMVPRLTREMLRVLHADAVSVRGQRNVIDGEAELLKGFEFNVELNNGEPTHGNTLFSKGIGCNAGIAFALGCGNRL